MRSLILAALVLVSCGTEPHSDTKIVGGQQVGSRTFYGRMEVGGRFRCGSTLIYKKWALSAAHCISESDANRTKLRFNAGSSNIDLVPVKKIYIHPLRDLALLKLERESKFKPIKFNNGSHLKDREGQRLKAFGFGQTSYNSRGVPPKLMGVVLRYVSMNWKVIRTDASQGKAVCFGDSGGPLLHGKTLVGVASWTGSKCGSLGSGNDGFARPDYFWIKEIVER